jgi:hypothetical protein
VNDELDALVRELETAATRLRAGELEPKAAADLVDRCAELAGRIGAALDQAGREAEREVPSAGQEQLL